MAKRATDIIDIYVGKNIKYQRNRRGISTEELGKVLEVSFQQIQKYEKAQNRISASMLYKLALAFNINTDECFVGLKNVYKPDTLYPKVKNVEENLHSLARLLNVDIQDIYKFVKIFKEFIDANEDKD